MKRRDLLKRLGDAAKANDVTFVLLREGAEHSIYSYGGARLSIPRHSEIAEGTARKILRFVGL